MQVNVSSALCSALQADVLKAVQNSQGIFEFPYVTQLGLVASSSDIVCCSDRYSLQYSIYGTMCRQLAS